MRRMASDGQVVRNTQKWHEMAKSVQDWSRMVVVYGEELSVMMYTWEYGELLGYI